MAEENEENVEEDYNPEEEVTGNWKVDVNLPEVPLITGEENDECLVKFRTKLYRWHDKQWKERGVGDLKFFKNKQSNKVRIVMRQDKTLKVVANFFIRGPAPLCQLAPNKTTEKAWVWTCYDNSDDSPSITKMCGRFTSVDEYKKFQTEFEKYLVENQAQYDKEQQQQTKKEEAAAKEESKQD